MTCYACGNPIPKERLEAIPDATHCIDCLKAKGDVTRKVGRLVFDHKTGGTLQVSTPEQLAALKSAEDSVEERVSRL